VPAWEQGSFFPMITGTRGEAGPGFDRGRFFGSGRQALIALVLLGKRKLGWERLLLPTYYCPEVVEDLSAVIRVQRYPANPFTHSIEVQTAPNDVTLVMSYFGEEPPALNVGTCIVDATHDPIAPWLQNYPAAYVVASLRKTLPLPDGGVVWSPTEQILPPSGAVDGRHLARTSQVAAAMSMKANYLAGERVDKDDYLSLFRDAEKGLCGTRPTKMSSLSHTKMRTFPVHEWRTRRLENIAYAHRSLAELEWLAIIPSTFGVVLRCRSHSLRESLRKGLLDHKVYPAVLWTLDRPATPHADLGFSREMLFLHADFRWTIEDMRTVVDLVLRSAETVFARRQSD
jgi:hypothetical protein